MRPGHRSPCFGHEPVTPPMPGRGPGAPRGRSASRVPLCARRSTLRKSAPATRKEKWRSLPASAGSSSYSGRGRSVAFGVIGCPSEEGMCEPESASSGSAWAAAASHEQHQARGRIRPSTRALLTDPWHARRSRRPIRIAVPVRHQSYRQGPSRIVDRLEPAQPPIVRVSARFSRRAG